MVRNAGQAQPETTTDAPRGSTGWTRAGVGALVGLLSLILAFIPEIVASFLGAVLGVAFGIVTGAGLVASLLDGGGSWGHAGPIALLLPLLALLGPVVIGVLVGATALPTLTLGVHAIVILVRRKKEMTTRRLVVLTTAASVFLPVALLGILVGEPYAAGIVLGLLLAPVTGALGLLVGAATAGARSLLAGRTLAQWWRDADGSMGVGMLAASLFAWLGTWVPLAIFVLLPAVVLALLVALALGARLWLAGDNRGLVATVSIVNLLHALGLGWAAAMVMTS